VSVFPWAPFRTAKAAIKLHTLLDLRGNIPAFIHISDGKTHEVNLLDMLIFESGAFYVLDRGYLDFSRLFALHQAGAFFVTRAKRGMDARRVYSLPTDRNAGIICVSAFCSTASTSRRTTQNSCGASDSKIRKPARRWYF
jgi:hypothetical protein